MTNDWQFLQPLIDGVVLKELRSVPAGYGFLTEAYRADWNLDVEGVQQVFQSVLEPGRVSAWHAHELTTDRLFCAFGMLHVVLYDARKLSPTFGMLNSFRIGTARPATIVVPPKVWHGIQNISHQPTVITNVVDRAYQYESPDHWRLPADSPEILFSFGSGDR